MNRVKVIKDHLVFPVKNPERAKHYFPQAKLAHARGKWHVAAVPHTVEATRLLRNVGLDVPAPVSSRYRWPGRFTPFDHQRVTTEFLTMNRRGFCLNGMGTGKTLSNVWAADYLMREGEVHKCLIVAPLSTLERVWADELFFTLPDRSFAVLHGTRNKRMELLEQDHDFYIINHDGIQIIAEQLAERHDIDLIIIDECAVYRNARTKRWRTMNYVLNKQGVDRWVWGLTGTPTPNAPTDAYGQMKLIKPENYRGSFTTFRDDAMLQVNQFRWVPRRGAEDLVHQILSPAIRFALEDCIDLPPTIRQDRQCALSAMQTKHYKELMDEALTIVGGSEITAVNAAVLVNKLVQAACGVLYSSDGSVQEIDFGPRLALLKEVIEECSEKVIVFVPLSGVLHALRRELAKDWTVEVVDGSVSATRRNQIFHEFQNEKHPRILLANAGTMAHGLTLTAASMIIWYAPTNNNDTYNQANARIVRPSQKNVTNIVHMYATAGERNTYKALWEKTRMQDVVLDLVRGNQ